MNFRKIAASLVLLACLAGSAFAQQGQNTLTSTTLSGAVTGPSVYNGTSPTLQSYVCLAATTGIANPVLPGTPVSLIYVDREVMGVWQVNTSTNCVLVNRGYLGTQAAPHSNAAYVLIATQYSTTSLTGGNPVPSGFFQQDPPQFSTCSATVPVYPWVNVLTGAQWLCSTITNTWVPGFNNPLALVSPGPTTAVASATTITPSGPFFHLTGTTSITTITAPIGCNATAVGACEFTVICDGVCTWANSGNILTAAGTVVAGTAVTFYWNPATSKWIPNTTT